MDQNQQKIRLTSNLVKKQGVMITLRRPPQYTSDGAGGQKPPTGDPTDQAAVRRFVGGITNRASDDMPATTLSSAAERHAGRVVIIGMPGDDIQERDEFDFNGNTYKVDFVDKFSLAWETKAEATQVEI